MGWSPSMTFVEAQDALLRGRVDVQLRHIYAPVRPYDMP